MLFRASMHYDEYIDESEVVYRHLFKRDFPDVYVMIADRPGIDWREEYKKVGALDYQDLSASEIQLFRYVKKGHLAKIVQMGLYDVDALFTRQDNAALTARAYGNELHEYTRAIFCDRKGFTAVEWARKLHHQPILDYFFQLSCRSLDDSLKRTITTFDMHEQSKTEYAIQCLQPVASFAAMARRVHRWKIMLIAASADHAELIQALLFSTNMPPKSGYDLVLMNRMIQIAMTHGSQKVLAMMLTNLADVPGVELIKSENLHRYAPMMRCAHMMEKYGLDFLRVALKTETDLRASVAFMKRLMASPYFVMHHAEAANQLYLNEGMAILHKILMEHGKAEDVAWVFAIPNFMQRHHQDAYQYCLTHCRNAIRVESSYRFGEYAIFNGWFGHFTKQVRLAALEAVANALSGQASMEAVQAHWVVIKSMPLLALVYHSWTASVATPAIRATLS